MMHQSDIGGASVHLIGLYQPGTCINATIDAMYLYAQYSTNDMVFQGRRKDRLYYTQVPNVSSVSFLNNYNTYKRTHMSTHAVTYASTHTYT